MEKLLKILRETRPDIDFDTADNLITHAALDSFDIITIVGEINDTFDIYINAGDLQPENFNSAQSIWKLIVEYQDKL